MPRAPADQKKSKRDSRLRPVSNVKWDPFGWVLPEGPKRPAKEVEHNVNGLETKPSFYAMVKKALLANKMHYLRGVSLHHILLYVAANWPVDLATYRRLTRLAVKRAVENGKILLVDGPGAAHYRLSPEERPTKEGAKGRKTEEEEEEPAKPAKRNTKNSAKAAPAKKRGAQQKSKPKRKAAEALDSPAPKKKKATKQRAGTDHAQKQAGEGKWVWQYQDGGWNDYDANASDEVENTYQIYEKEKATGRVIDVRAVKSGQWDYMIDFRQMTQQNVRHEAHTVRNIRRVWRSMA